MEPSACRSSPGDLWGWVESQAKVITSDGLKQERLWITGPSEPNKCVRETSTEKEKRESESGKCSQRMSAGHPQSLSGGNCSEILFTLSGVGMTWTHRMYKEILKCL